MNSLSLYLHYPFCRRKCAYCDFYSQNTLSQRTAYERAMLDRIRALSPRLEGYCVTSVYFGGGTPSLSSPEGLGQILSALHASFHLSSDCEITMECNPESTSEAVLTTAGEGGVNRISLGMQSAKDEELALLGRLHHFTDVVSAVERIRRVGFDNISLDLMYGLPWQKKTDFSETISRAMALYPKHLSLYCLTLSKRVPLYQKKDFLPEDDTLYEMYLSALSQLNEGGFEQYEISNVAQKGYASRHNLRYWEGGDYYGIGAGAHSLFESERFHVREDVEAFISNSNDPSIIVSDGVLTNADRIEEYVLLSLRTVQGLSLSRLQDLAGEERCKQIREKFECYLSHGLARKTPNGYALTPQGFFVSNEIISQLL